jgi:ATP adenylyltransferase
VTQIEYYTERVKRMVGKVLTGNGITRYERGTYDLVGGEELSDAERDELLQLCRQRLDAFRMQRGEEVGYLLTQKPAASGTGAATARRSAARSKSGCSPVPRATANVAAQAVAWQTPHQRALEVDHIVPRNHGGSDDLSNLQPLCFRCNAAKRDAVCLRKRAPPTSAACRPATPVARTVVCSARWSPAAGCCWRTNWRSASPMPIR